VSTVIQQKYENWEMLIGINGHGPTGGEVAAAARTIAAKDPNNRIRVLVQESAHSKVESLNDLMKHCNGEWICLLDCDDIWHPEKLSSQVGCVQTVGKNAAVIGTACTYFGQMQGRPVIQTGFVTFDSLLKGNQIINSSAMIHRSYCRWRSGYGMEDYDMWLRIAAMGGVLYNIPDALVGHRIHGGSAFNSKGHEPELLQTDFKNAAASHKDVFWTNN
jgi:teichuronic acid biosynthesis glycosyltransferase TuaG